MSEAVKVQLADLQLRIAEAETALSQARQAVTILSALDVNLGGEMADTDAARKLAEAIAALAVVTGDVSDIVIPVPDVVVNVADKQKKIADATSELNRNLSLLTTGVAAATKILISLLLGKVL